MKNQILVFCPQVHTGPVSLFIVVDQLRVCKSRRASTKLVPLPPRTTILTLSRSQFPTLHSTFSISFSRSRPSVQSLHGSHLHHHIAPAHAIFLFRSDHLPHKHNKKTQSPFAYLYVDWPSLKAKRKPSIIQYSQLLVYQFILTHRKVVKVTCSAGRN